MFCFIVPYHLFDYLLWFPYICENFSSMFNIPLLLTVCNTFIMSSIGPIACVLFMRCCVNFDFPYLFLKSLRCSWKHFWKDLPVCPIYFLLQVWQDSWSTMTKLLVSQSVARQQSARQNTNSNRRICHKNCSMKPINDVYIIVQKHKSDIIYEHIYNYKPALQIYEHQHP